MPEFNLNLDDLQIQTFATTETPRATPRGTVLGQSILPYEDTGFNDPACNGVRVYVRGVR